MRPLLIALLAGFASLSQLSAADLDMAGLDTPRDKIAVGKRLLLWVQSMGYDAVLSDDGEDVFIREIKLSVSPVLDLGDGVDRLIIYNTYAGKPGNAGNPELAAAVKAANDEQIAAQISVLSSGSVLFVTYVSFDDKLSPVLFRKFLEHSNKMAELILAANPRLAKFIR